MAITYKIQILQNEKYEIEPGEGKVDTKRVSFEVRDTEKKRVLMIDKSLPIVSGKTDDSYCSDAQSLMTDQIADWQKEIATAGKIFNPDSGKIE